jgi:D-alanyl-D-alanine carboxypeptidase
VAFRTQPPVRAAFFGCLSAVAAMLAAVPAAAGAQLLIEADSGKVLHAENATYPWYPASTTKLMTLYVTLQAMREGRLTADTLMTVSSKAAAQPPSKMGIKAGNQVTVDNALKMLMVKSANDIAVTVAEGVSGSVEAFADEMNATAQRLGMVQSSFVNPHGLPADNQISSARDMGILARALMHDFPRHEFYWRIPAIRYGKIVTRNYNKLMERYPGADGMKTGYICASGFNLVASATRGGKKLIAVVFGAPSSAVRAVKAAQLLERGFNGGGLSWLTPSLGTVDALVPIAAAPPNLREEMCGKDRRKPAAEDEDVEDEIAASRSEIDGTAVMLSSLRAPAKPFTLGGAQRLAEPIDVFVGGSKKGGVASGSLPGAKPVTVKTVQAAPAAPAKLATAGIWSSLTPIPIAEAAPTSMAPMLSEDAALVPLPRPRPTINAALIPAAAPANPPAAKPAAVKPAAATKPAANKPAAAIKPAAANKPATAKPAASKASASAAVKPR